MVTFHPEMNFDIPYGGKDRLLQPKIFPILILIKQWSLQGEAALMDTRTILYLLQILQGILCKHEVHTHYIYILYTYMYLD